MAEPLSALATVGAVSSILQILDFTAAVAKHTYELLRSPHDALRENLDIERLTREDQLLSQNICTDLGTSRPLTAQDAALEDLAKTCKEEASALLQLLDGLKLKEQRGVKRAYHGLAKGFSAEKQRKYIEGRSQNLRDLNGRLATRLVYILRSASSHHEGLLREIERNSLDGIGAILESKKMILEAVQAQQQRHDAGVESIKEAVSNGFAEVSKSYQETKNTFLDDKEMEARTREHEDSVGTLRFPEMNARRNAIQLSYASTYEWFFRKDESDFPEWLRSGKGLFWLSGKAGSGKSTAMKFLAGHQKTKVLCRQWVGQNRQLVIADFYFWYVGSRMQHSVEGLLRSILAKILTACPSLMEAARASRRADTGSSFLESISWTADELYSTLERVTRYMLAQEASEGAKAAASPRFCFFIDGLDEYKGDQLQLAVYLKDSLAQHPHFKICVSSRPWNVFNSVFGTSTTCIRLEDLTRPDILAYVSGNVAYARRYCDSLTTGCSGDSDIVDIEARYTDLVQSIVAKAHGVFLRLDQFPEDLDVYFRHILNRVDKVYEQQTASALLLAEKIADQELMSPSNKLIQSAAANARSFLSYWWLRKSGGDINQVFRCRIVECSVERLRDMRSETQISLSAWCRDLLQVSRPHPDTTLGWQPYIKLHRVEFLHRTVYDFLKTDHVQPLLAKYRPPFCSDDVLFWSRLTVARLRVVPSLEARSQRELCFQFHGEVCSYFYNEAGEICRAFTAFKESSAEMEMVRDLDDVGQHYLHHPSKNCRGDCQEVRIQEAARLYSCFAACQTYQSLKEFLTKPKTMLAYARCFGDSRHCSGFHDDVEVCAASLLRSVLGLSGLRKFTLADIDQVALSHILQYIRESGHRSYPHDDHKVWYTFVQQWATLKHREAAQGAPTGRTTELRDENFWKVARLLLRLGADPCRLVYCEHDGGERTAAGRLAECVPEADLPDLASYVPSGLPVRP
ncbi:hypothetical protein LTR37_006479 [Vermiconidia calcicola]|uniref:Uncharacterized protein n=1 Tax=Vermiconidia calcicola TaxID=1690605 RepID=A0ACC3NHQ2_9PEZI|nr:hypothetical protein LTR37_006479 [Vermiconidia calcicola]